jgi:hypothetical protein
MYEHLKAILYSPDSYFIHNVEVYLNYQSGGGCCSSKPNHVLLDIGKVDSTKESYLDEYNFELITESFNRLFETNYRKDHIKDLVDNYELYSETLNNFTDCEKYLILKSYRLGNEIYENSETFERWLEQNEYDISKLKEEQDNGKDTSEIEENHDNEENISEIEEDNYNEEDISEIEEENDNEEDISEIEEDHDNEEDISEIEEDNDNEEDISEFEEDISEIEEEIEKDHDTEDRKYIQWCHERDEVTNAVINTNNTILDSVIEFSLYNYFIFI